MFALSKTTGYAIRALVCLADRRCTPASVERIAACSGVPRPYLAKSVSRLAAAGIVTTKRGPKGGLRLARPPDAISLLDISNVVDGEDYLCRCLLGEEYCDDNRNCPTHAFWKRTRGAIRAKLAKTTLADVVAFEKQKRRKRTARRSPSARPRKRLAKTPGTRAPKRGAR